MAIKTVENEPKVGVLISTVDDTQEIVKNFDKPICENVNKTYRKKTKVITGGDVFTKAPESKKFEENFAFATCFGYCWRRFLHCIKNRFEKCSTMLDIYVEYHEYWVNDDEENSENAKADNDGFSTHKQLVNPESDSKKLKVFQSDDIYQTCQNNYKKGLRYDKTYNCDKRVISGKTVHNRDKKEPNSDKTVHNDDKRRNNDNEDNCNEDNDWTNLIHNVDRKACHKAPAAKYNPKLYKF